MSSISRRIDTIEKQLSIGRHEEPKPPEVILCLLGGRIITVEDEAILGPTETWITYQKQLQAGQRENLKENSAGLPGIITIELDADKEYQAREQLKATKNNEKPEN